MPAMWPKHACFVENKTPKLEASLTFTRLHSLPEAGSFGHIINPLAQQSFFEQAPLLFYFVPLR